MGTGELSLQNQRLELSLKYCMKLKAYPDNSAHGSLSSCKTLFFAGTGSLPSHIRISLRDNTMSEDILQGEWNINARCSRYNQPVNGQFFLQCNAEEMMLSYAVS